MCRNAFLSSLCIGLLLAVLSCGGGGTPTPQVDTPVETPDTPDVPIPPADAELGQDLPGEVPPADVPVDVEVQPPDEAPEVPLDQVEGPDAPPPKCTSDQDCILDREVGPCVKVWCDLAIGECVKGDQPDGVACEVATKCEKDGMCKAGACMGVPVACDDGNLCTDDSCDPGQGCVFANNTAPCDDGNTCTTGDTCDGGKCAGKMNTCACTTDADCAQYEDGDLCKGPLFCKDGFCEKDSSKDVVCAPSTIPCVESYCDPATGQCGSKAAPDGTKCDDGSVCTKGESCHYGDCVADSFFDVFVEIVVCDDGNLCTDEVCDPKLGCVIAPNQKQCDDGNLCTTDDKCTGGVCIGTPGPDCGCTKDEDCAKAEDGDKCNGTLKCAGGACVLDPATVIVCPQKDDMPLCWATLCDPATGKCEDKAVADGTKCEDGDACTTASECKEGKCIGTASLACDDGNPCTDDSCDQKSGCVFANNTAPCDDGDACTSGDACMDGKCAGPAISCDDQNPCTDDSCDSAAGCVNANNTAACDDGSACTGNDACIDGKCAGGALKVCDDGNACTTDSCDAVAGCVFANNTDPCDDGDPCTSGDACAEGKCAGGAPTVCNDLNPCTDDSCDAGQGCVFKNNTADCDDGSACTTADICADGKCVGGPAPDCDDKNPCTSDKCDPAKGCVNENNTLACDDQDACTANDTCKEGKCAGTAVTCDDKNPCTDDSCDKATGCAFKPNTLPCDDGNKCTTGDTCAAGKCVGGAPLDCDDKNACTADTCVPLVGCVSVNTVGPCDDGDLCSEKDFCKDGKCMPGSARVCDDSNPCTQDSCDPAKGCVYEPIGDGTPCDDKNACTQNDMCAAGKCVGEGLTCDDDNPCTDDTCTDPAQGCKFIPNSNPCDDGSVCTTGDKCVNSQCKGQGTLNCDDGNPCTDDFCDPVKGCIYVNNTAPCDDKNACTTKDTCASGKCAGGPALTCDDGNACTDDSCDAGKGCLFVNNTAPCDDGNACTTKDTCASGKCAGGPPPNCDDGNSCTNDKCDPVEGCVHTYNSLPCDDKNLCTKDDTCSMGQCAGKPITCDDNNVCTTDTCDPAKGCVFTNNTLACDDGNPCTSKDQCLDGKCQGGAATDCDDKNPCTSDACVPPVGCIHVNNQNPCDDGDKCTTGDQCSEGKCVGGAAVNCDDNNLCTNDKCDKLLGCIYVNNTYFCNDGNACTTKDQCKDGKCQGGPPPVCDDKNVCTTDSCDPFKGCQYAANTLPCDDGNACTEGYLCKDSKCVGGTAKVCNDNNPCTKDSCDPALGCVYTPLADGTLCDDGNKCTTGDACAAGKCVGKGVNCDDGNPCTDDKCDDPVQGCYHVNNTAACDDGNVCTTKDQCSNGQCKGQGTLNCDDGNVCTDDKCDPTQGCFHLNNTLGCDDKNACTTKDTCSNGQCAGQAVVCDDKNPCTDDSCDPTTGCVYKNNTAACDDGNACTTKDTCSAGKCVGGPALDCNDNNVCTDDKCDPLKGCIYAFNTAACDDKNACTTKDTCSLGQCVGGPALDCNDNNVCTDDKCDPASGCVYSNNTAACDDNNKCTTKDTCAAGKCVGGPPPNCDDSNVCTDDSCKSDLGCVYTYNTKACDDGNACTTKDTCASGKCVGGPAPDCDDKNVCTTDTCDPKLGCVHTNNTLPCEDGSKCTAGDTCKGGTCMPGPAVVCDDKNTCTSDSCDPAVGCVFKALPDNTKCDDSNPCTTSDACKAGVCVGGAALNCDDLNDCTKDWCQDFVGCQHQNLPNGAKCGKIGQCWNGKCIEWEFKLSESVQGTIATDTRLHECGRPEKGAFYVSGGDNGWASNAQIAGIYTINETDLTFSDHALQQNSNGWFLGQFARLAVGSYAVSARYYQATSGWSTNSGLPDFSTKSDMLAIANSGTSYWVGGKVAASGSLITSTVRSCTEVAGLPPSFPCVTMALIGAPKDCTQKAVEVRGAYASAANRIFFAGYEAVSGGAGNAVIASTDGNKSHNCPLLGDYKGEVYYNNSALENDYDLVVPITAKGPGAFNDVHGISTTDVWAVGELGTIYRFNGFSWSKLDPSKDVPSFGVAHNIQAVWADGTSGIHMVGTRSDVTGCLTPFYLHAYKDAASAAYVFNGYQDLTAYTTCSPGKINLADVTVDQSTGYVYVVGWAPYSNSSEVWGLVARWKRQ